MKAVQFRIARPTNKLGDIQNFYGDALDLKVIGRFENHAGFNGIMFGLPDEKHHLEFTQQKEKALLPQPTKENLLVLYYNNPEEYKNANSRLQEPGFKPVAPENSYWLGKSETYEDPDGWRVVLFDGVYNRF